MATLALSQRVLGPSEVCVFDAVVVGAGVCGSYAANQLAISGFQTLVLEKKPGAGQDVCCTGIIGQDCFKLLKPDETLIHGAHQRAEFFFPSGRTLHLHRPEAVAYIIDRNGLDRQLHQRALQNGAKYRFQSALQSIRPLSHGLELTVLERGEPKIYQTRALILATGYSSPLPQRMGMGAIPDYLIGAQAEVELHAPTGVEVYLDQKRTPGGFAWLAPTAEGKALVGLITRKGHTQKLHHLLAELEGAKKISTPSNCINSGAIPISTRPKTYGNRMLAIGDAAGQVKPTTGGGIYYGLLAAQLACETLKKGFISDNLSARALSHYQRQWKRKLRREIFVGYAAHRLWSRLNNHTLEQLLDLALHHDLQKTVYESEAFSFDFHAPLLTLLSTQLPLEWPGARVFNRNPTPLRNRRISG